MVSKFEKCRDSPVQFEVKATCDFKIYTCRRFPRADNPWKPPHEEWNWQANVHGKRERYNRKRAGSRTFHMHMFGIEIE